MICASWQHDDVIKWKHFPRHWPFVRSPVNSPHKGQWRRALMFSLTCVWINGWVNNGEAGDLRRYRAYYDVTVMRIRGPEVLCCVESTTTSKSKALNILVNELGFYQKLLVRRSPKTRLIKVPFYKDVRRCLFSHGTSQLSWRSCFVYNNSLSNKKEISESTTKYILLWTGVFL